jgi:hypothetical protein
MKIITIMPENVDKLLILISLVYKIWDDFIW